MSHHNVQGFMCVSLAALLCLVLSATASVVAQTATRKVVYIRNSEVWVMNLDGSAQTKVCNCTNAQRPVLSPDSLKIAFEMNNNMYVVNVGGTGLLNLTPGGGMNYYASWSPDSTKIVFQSDGAAGGNASIYRVNVNGSGLTRLTLGDGARPSWSPNGSKIAFIVNGEVNVMSAAGGPATQLTSFHATGFDGFNRPIWSPDSSRLISNLGWSCGDPRFELGGLYIMNADPLLGGVKRITNCGWHNGPDFWVAWSPNGRRLAIRLGDYMTTMNTDGSGVIFVGPGAYTYSNPIWTPDGKRVVYVYGVYPFSDIELYAANADGTGYTDLTNTPGIGEWQADDGRGITCDLATIPAPPTQTVSTPWPYDLDGINPNWSMTAEVSANDGLVLKDVKLGQRYMAKRISVPYYFLQTSAFPRQRGELKPNSTDPTMRSRLVDYAVTTDAEKMVLEATYAIDLIGQSCLQIIQRYEFYKQGVGGGCEPSETLPCSRWKPIVEYQFLSRNSETLTAINVAQRQHKRIDDNAYNSVGLFKDCDTPPSCGPSAGNSIPGLFGYERKSNPLYYEVFEQAIARGQNSNKWDNIHQTYLGRISEPPLCVTCPNSYFVGGGCPECEHSHWRWGSMFGGAFNNGRILGIPANSDQDLDFAVVRYQSGEEDPTEIKDIVQTAQMIRTYNIFGRSPLQISWGSAPEEIVVWYYGTGRQNSDAFFGHGGFFNPTLTNRQLYNGSWSAPSELSSAPMSLGQDSISSVDASQIFEAGETTTSPFDANSVEPLPAGYSQYASLSYDVATTAESSGPYTLSFSLASVTDQTVFNNLRVFHLEQDPYDPEAVMWVDRTVLSPDSPAPDFAAKTINAKTNLLGPVVVGSLTNPQPPNNGVANLALSLTDSSDPIVAGNNLTYNLSLTNLGPQTATGVRLADPLPPSTDIVSIVSSQGTCKEAEGSVVCKLGSINAGLTATVTIVVKAGAGFAVPPGGQSITNLAYAVANEADSNTANNTSTENTTILPDPNIAPTVIITSPTNGNLVPGPTDITISVTASDSDGSISQVELIDNGESIGMGIMTGANQYSFTWTNVGFGDHSIVAIATDNIGKKASSAAANIFVNGTANVYIWSPIDNAQFTTPGDVLIRAADGQSGANISKVDFYANTMLIGTGTSEGQGLYRVTWNNPTSGSYALTVAATDNSGVVTISNPVRINVYLAMNQSPAVNLTTPLSGATYTTPTSIALTATATDTDGSISSVDFYSDGVLLGRGGISGANQYSFTWPNPAAGNHLLVALATDNAGTTMNSTWVSINVLSPALLVAGSTTLNTSDTAIKARLEALNYSVTVKAASSATTADATGKAVVVISSTVTPTAVGTKFRTVAVPVVTWESGLFTNMGMTGSTNKDFGTITKQTQVKITNATHPLAAGLSGTISVVNTSGTLSWGKPNANAAAIATVATDTTKTLIFGYATGAVMPGLTAPARRVGLFMNDTTAAGFTTSGAALFDAAIKWATGRI